MREDISDDDVRTIVDSAELPIPRHTGTPHTATATHLSAPVCKQRAWAKRIASTRLYDVPKVMPKRGSIASCACAPCRKRKTRCDGSRPTCKACEQRRVECRYDVEEGITRTAALKSKLEQLELDYGSIVDLHSQLKHGQPDEVAALVNRIRAEDSPDGRPPIEPGSIMPDGHPDEPEGSEDMASEANWDSFNTPSTGFGDMQQRQNFPPNPFYAGMPENIPIDPALAGLDPQLRQYNDPDPASLAQQNTVPVPYEGETNLNMYGLPVSSPGAPISARQLFQTHTPSMLRLNIAMVRQGFALQSRSMPESCSAYTESQVESLISVVEMNPDHEIPRARLCELSSIAAVAAQYVQGALPLGVIEFFYDAAKHFFEDCMQSPIPHLVPLKVCAMLALANILRKSFLAFVYIDLGLSLAQSLDEPILATPQNLQRQDFMEAKRVRETLLSLRNYATEYAGLNLGNMGGGSSSGRNLQGSGMQ